MTATEMGDRIVEKVANYGHVSFVEIVKLIGPEAKGSMVWEVAPNVMLWCGISTKLVEALELVRNRIIAQPASWLVYLCDGGIPRFPIAKRVPRGGYKKPHWLPVTFSLRKRRG